MAVILTENVPRYWSLWNLTWFLHDQEDGISIRTFGNWLGTTTSVDTDMFKV